MTKAITVNLDDIKIEITLDEIIDKEVKARVKKEVDKIREEFKKFKEGLPVIQTYGRREGNSYRAMLYAQLLASGRPEQNVFVLCHSFDNAEMMLRHTAELINVANVKFQMVKTRRMIHIENNSRIFFTTSDAFYNGPASRGLRNINIIHDDWN